MFSTCRDTLAISGSGEHRSIHGLQAAIICALLSPGSRVVSSDVNCGTRRNEELSNDCDVDVADSKESTLEWNCGVVIGVVIKSYCIK